MTAAAIYAQWYADGTEHYPGVCKTMLAAYQQEVDRVERRCARLFLPVPVEKADVGALHCKLEPLKISP